MEFEARLKESAQEDKNENRHGRQEKKFVMVCIQSIKVQIKLMALLNL